MSPVACYAHSPLPGLVLLCILLTLPVTLSPYRRGLLGQGQALALLAAPLVPVSIAVAGAALMFRDAQTGMAASGATGRGTVASAMADVQQLRLFGLVPGVLLALISLSRLWGSARQGAAGSALGLVPYLVVISLGACVALTSVPRASAEPSWLATLLAVFGLLVSAVLVVVARRWSAIDAPALRLAGSVLLAVLTLGLAAAALAYSHATAVAQAG